MILFMYDYEKGERCGNRKLLADLIFSAKIEKDPRILSLLTVWTGCEFFGEKLYGFLKKNTPYLKKRLGVENWALSCEDENGNVTFFGDAWNIPQEKLCWTRFIDDADTKEKYDFFYARTSPTQECVRETIESIQGLLLSLYDAQEQQYEEIM